jgi:hypothetical protein
MAAIVLVALVIAGGFGYYLLTVPRTGPNSFAVYNETEVSPGSIGCSTIPGEICFSLMMISEFDGLQLSDVHFHLTNGTTADESGPAVPVGASAGVTVLQTPDEVAGHLNWSTGAWTNGSGWSVPVNVGVELIFDSGLQSSVSLNGANFWISLSSPGSGSAGVGLYPSGG